MRTYEDFIRDMKARGRTVDKILAVAAATRFKIDLIKIENHLTKS